MFNLIKYKFWFIGFSVLITILAITSMVKFGFRPGIDFAGGSMWEIKFDSNNTVGVEQLSDFFSSKKIEGFLVRPGQAKEDFSVRLKELSEQEHQDLRAGLAEKFGSFEEMSFSSIGPAIGKELQSRSILAFCFVLLGISLYIAFAFRKVAYPISSWKYGLATLICLFHDSIIPAGLFAFWGYKYGAEIDTNFIVAILVIMGFSVHDTIVVFDRIRENLLHSKKKEDFSTIINQSVNQTFTRSFNTSFTLFIVLIALYMFGVSSLGYFALIILIGTIIGTYSSIFVASPLLTFFYRKN